MISNCVINLSVDKPAVLTEIARVLKPGGRIGISDIVAEDRLRPGASGRARQLRRLHRRRALEGRVRGRARGRRLRADQRRVHPRGRRRHARRDRQGASRPRRPSEGAAGDPAGGDAPAAAEATGRSTDHGAMVDGCDADGTQLVTALAPRRRSTNIALCVELPVRLLHAARRLVARRRGRGRAGAAAAVARRPAPAADPEHARAGRRRADLRLRVHRRARAVRSRTSATTSSSSSTPGVIARERRGRFSYYALVDGALDQIAALVALPASGRPREPRARARADGGGDRHVRARLRRLRRDHGRREDRRSSATSASRSRFGLVIMFGIYAVGTSAAPTSTRRSRSRSR